MIINLFVYFDMKIVFSENKPAGFISPAGLSDIYLNYSHGLFPVSSDWKSSSNVVLSPGPEGGA